jgi:hypothetical protein
MIYTICIIDKCEDEFDKNRRQCKFCLLKKTKLQKKKYYEINRDRMLQCKKDYYDKNINKI